MNEGVDITGAKAGRPHDVVPIVAVAVEVFVKFLVWDAMSMAHVLPQTSYTSVWGKKPLGPL